LVGCEGCQLLPTIDGVGNGIASSFWRKHKHRMHQEDANIFKIGDYLTVQNIGSRNDKSWYEAS